MLGILAFFTNWFGEWRFPLLFCSNVMIGIVMVAYKFFSDQNK